MNKITYKLIIYCQRNNRILITTKSKRNSSSAENPSMQILQRELVEWKERTCSGELCPQLEFWKIAERVNTWPELKHEVNKFVLVDIITLNFLWQRKILYSSNELYGIYLKTSVYIFLKSMKYKILCLSKCVTV